MMYLIFIHGPFKLQENKNYFVYDGYAWMQEKLYEYTDHIELDANFLDSWESPRFVDRSGNEIRFTEQELRFPHQCYEKLAQEGHIIFWNSSLNTQHATYVMYHPIYLSPIQKTILKNVILEGNIEFYEVNEQGEVTITPYKNNHEEIKEHLQELITRTQKQSTTTQNKVKIKK